MLSVVFVSTEPVIDVIIDSPSRNKPIEARFASSRKCKQHENQCRAIDSNTFKNRFSRFYGCVMGGCLKVKNTNQLHLSFISITRVPDFKPNLIIIGPGGARGDRRITREANANEKSSS